MTPASLAERSGLKSASAADAGLDPAALARLTDALQRQVDKGLIPGACAMIFRNGAVGYSAQVGAARPDGAPLNAETIFRIYSMTKPIVSLAAMQLVEEGRLLLSDPLAKTIPAFAATKVGIESDGELQLVEQRRPITIQDLLRHTSGLTYGFTGVSKVQKLYHASGVMRTDASAAEHCETLAAMPLRFQPGEAWEYGHSTDVLGRVLEVIEGERLGALLKRRVFDPLGMADTAFFTPPGKLARRAELISVQTFNNWKVFLCDSTEPPAFESGGGGLLSTLPDYARFCAMLLGGGALDGASLIGPHSLRYMTANHLPPDCSRKHFILSPGYGFGLGFAVREEVGLASAPGTVGEFNWGGAAGTAFWVAPRDGLFAILMMQTADHGETIRPLFRNMVYAALR